MRARDELARSEQTTSPAIALHAFEPVASTRVRLRTAVAKWSSTVRVHDYGLGGANRSTCFVGSGITAREVHTWSQTKRCPSPVDIVDIAAALGPLPQARQPAPGLAASRRASASRAARAGAGGLVARQLRGL